jgi:hypothetical protein
MGGGGVRPLSPDCSGIYAADAKLIDTKIDDGKPYSGNVVIMASQGGYIYNISSGSNGSSPQCTGYNSGLNGGSNAYATNNPVTGGRANSCAVYIKGQFGD